MEALFLNSKRYIAKKDTWFKEGTECKLLEDYKEAGGLYRGIYIVGENKGYDTFWPVDILIKLVNVYQ